MTLPSPRMVLPLNMVTWRRIGATGLTTISSVSKTRSTMMPKTCGADLGDDDEGALLAGVSASQLQQRRRG